MAQGKYSKDEGTWGEPRPVSPQADLREIFSPTPVSDSLYPTFDDLDNEPTVATVSGSAESEAVQLTRGTVVGHYELIRELGRGGMGHVFLARDTKLGRRVAIKFIATASAVLNDRFIAEARATAQCTHENIVVIHEVDAYRDLPYMVLEYLEGKTFKHLVASGRRLRAARAIELMTPVVKALRRAHELNIIHRDLKPDNIFLTNAGQVKVLDFGLVKVMADPSAANRATLMNLAGGADQRTRDGVFVGTPPYMSPEQLGVGAPVDHRSDIWAFGIILYRMIAGRHPLDKVTDQVLWHTAQQLDVPMPSLRIHAPDAPAELVAIVDGCLAKRVEHRWPDARQLLDAMLSLRPGNDVAHVISGESPYPGLSTFQEADAGRFFGRNREIARVVARLRSQPILAVVGPSGVGKSSLVRAGVVPALKTSGEEWDVFTVRPGRAPLASLASLILGDDATPRQIESVAGQLRVEPGLLGRHLRHRARRDRRPVLIFVDQFEELYTLIEDPRERLGFTACLRGVGDDVTAPLRVIVSMRSDFLDRVSEDRAFADELTNGLVLLSTPDREGLREALIQPLAMTSFQFEDPQIVDAMLTELEATTGALPLLQFAAAKLWELRDRHRNLLTNQSYLEIGGVGGALAAHADEVLTAIGSQSRLLVRNLFLRLVTPERTRAIVDVDELEELSPVSGEVRRMLQQLVSSRLLVVQNRGDGGKPAVEIVHESLITRWPQLRRWLDEDEGDAAFRAQLRSAAKQWESRGRPQGLLWRGEAAEDARRWLARTDEVVSGRERAFLDAVLSLASRAARRRRIAVAVVISVLAALVVGATVAMYKISEAEKSASAEAERATQEADRAREAETVAKREAAARAESEREIARQLEALKRSQAEKVAATQLAAQSKEELADANLTLRRTLEKLRAEKVKADRAVVEAEAAKSRAERAQRELKRRAEKAEKQLRKIGTELR